ncbi:hypothetical protein ACTA71_008346 [Dictyostelium dimigraforme]
MLLNQTVKPIKCLKFDSIGRSRGIPAIPGSVKEVFSFRKKIHLEIHKNLKYLQDNLKGNETGLESAGGLLAFDPILYPIPVICGAEGKSKNDYDKMSLYNAKREKLPSISINVNQRSRPFIYRIDGASMVGDIYGECMGGPRTVPSTKEPVTNCYGFYTEPEALIEIKLSEKKAVSCRVFYSRSEKYEEMEGYMDDQRLVEVSAGDLEGKLTIGGNESTWEDFTYESGSLRDVDNQKFSTTSGFFISKKYTNLKDFDVKVGMCHARLLFIEFVISDD